MTNTFTASNGYALRLFEDGWLNMDNAEGDCIDNVPPNRLTALREYFTAERDAELGRERDAINSDLVVYPKGDDQVCVINESACTIWDFTRSYALDALDDPGRLGAASRYFEQHPEPREWKSAPAGELWEITNTLGDTRTVITHGDGSYTSQDGTTWYANEIASATRIWPEESDDE